MFKSIALTGAVALALSTAGCAGFTGALTPSASSGVTNALALACPLLGQVTSSGLPLTAKQQAAAKTLALACPPNPPPTSATVAVADLIAAYQILAPVLK